MIGHFLECRNRDPRSPLLELVGEAGIPFAGDEDAVAAVERLAGELEERRARISIPSLQEVTTHYLQAMGV